MGSLVHSLVVLHIRLEYLAVDRLVKEVVAEVLSLDFRIVKVP